MKLKCPLHPSHIKHEYCSRVSLQSPHYICEVRRFALRVSFERCMDGKWSNTLFSYLVEILTLFAIYFSTARLGLSVDAVSRFATLVWVPSGIAIAALLLLAMPLSAIISATLGVSSLFLGKVIAFSSYYPAWRAWWIGDMISILILTPFLLTWSKWPHDNVAGKRIAEMGIVTLFVLAIGL